MNIFTRIYNLPKLERELVLVKEKLLDAEQKLDVLRKRGRVIEVSPIVTIPNMPKTIQHMWFGGEGECSITGDLFIGQSLHVSRDLTIGKNIKNSTVLRRTKKVAVRTKPLLN